MRGLAGGWLLVMVAAASACGSDDPWVSGTLRLADGVDPSMYPRLELRVLPREGDIPVPDTLEPDDEPVLSQTLELDGLAFPRDFDLTGEELYDADRGTVFAWMTTRIDSRWWEPGEPFGLAPFEMCACATHVPAYANDVMVTLELRRALDQQLGSRFW